jgi:hypothetical protein
MAKEFLKIYDLNFVGRPSMMVGKNMDFGSSRDGPSWSTMCKVCVLELLRYLKLLRFVREEEISTLINNVTKCFVLGEDESMSKVVSAMTTDIICRMAYDKKYCKDGLDNRVFKDMIMVVLFLCGVINVRDFFPLLEWMALQGLRHPKKSSP